jgi:hypothetical protein
MTMTTTEKNKRVIILIYNTSTKLKGRRFIVIARVFHRGEPRHEIMPWERERAEASYDVLWSLMALYEVRRIKNQIHSTSAFALSSFVYIQDVKNKTINFTVIMTMGPTDNIIDYRFESIRQAHCLALRAPTLDLWLEITKT